MKITSLSRRTDLIFARFSGQVIERENYVIIQTPDNPGYHWGNYLIFDRAPKQGDCERWKNIFRKEFPYYEEICHMVFTWDCQPPQKGEIQDFVENGFEFDEAKILSTDQLTYPKWYNQQIEIRKLQSQKDWDNLVRLQTLTADPRHLNDEYENFKRKQIAEYRAMTEKGMGHWFGAFIENELVGGLGIYFENELGRYQNVTTNPEYERQGICQTLVYETGLIALKDYGISKLVMEADANYHAARIYESVGFNPTEVSYALSWWDGI